MVFLGAFLSFSMEPIVGRLVTPLFGGAVQVWIVALMVFQGLLLAGYLYAHFLAPRLGGWHLVVLFLPALQWPLGLQVAGLSDTPTIDLISALLRQISLPFVILSTTAVVAQTWWFSARVRHGSAQPFFLYGISNLGAMVALFAYPFLVEPLFGLGVQRWLWSVGYVAYVVVTIAVWILLRPMPLRMPTAGLRAAAGGIAWPQIARWIFLGASTSALMLAVTNQMSAEIGAFPLVWVFPLALYLGSFIFAFRDQTSTEQQRLEAWLPEISLAALLGGQLLPLGAWVLAPTLGVYYLLCLIANRQLYRLRPHPSQLTSFYLAIAVGGCIGGILVSVVAPAVFSSLAEYPLAIMATAIASWSGQTLGWWRTASRLRGYGRLSVIVVGASVLVVAASLNTDVAHHRNFYGISRVLDRPEVNGTPAHRLLLHGQTIHGIQYLDKGRRGEPLAYYHTGGALYEAMLLRNRSEPVAMVGLGAGDALAWFTPGEAADLRSVEAEGSLRSRVVGQSSFLDWLDDLLIAMPQFALLLIRAGSPKKPAEYLLLSLGFGGIVTLASILFSRQGLLGSLAIFAIASALPVLNLARLAAKRREMFEDQLPDALDFIARSLRAGHGLTISMGMAADELPDPIGKEFKITFDEINFGIAFPEAMANLNARVNSPDLSFFTIAVVIQRETGGNLTELLAGLAKTIRERIKLKGKVRVLASEGKFSGYLLGGLPILLGAVMNALNPQYMALLWFSETGHDLLRTSAVMLTLGAAFMYKIAQIKV